MKKPLALASASLLLLGAGCMPSPKGTVEQATESKVIADPDTISYTDKDGNTVTSGRAVELPEEFPKDVPFMESAVLYGAGGSNDEAWATFNTPESFLAVIDWYEVKLKADGWAKYGSTSSTGQETGAFTKGDAWINVVASAVDDQTMVTVTRATQK